MIPIRNIRVVTSISRKEVEILYDFATRGIKNSQAHGSTGRMVVPGVRDQWEEMGRCESKGTRSFSCAR